MFIAINSTYSLYLYAKDIKHYCTGLLNNKFRYICSMNDVYTSLFYKSIIVADSCTKMLVTIQTTEYKMKL